MKKAICLVVLAAVAVLSSWVTGVEAMDGMAKLEICTASQDFTAEHHLPGGLPTPLNASTADHHSCTHILNECSAACPPNDPYCGQDCQCQWLMCRGYQCN